MKYWVVDNTVLSNFALINQMSLIKERLQKKIVIPEEVKKEFLVGMDKGVIPETDISWLKDVKRNEDGNYSGLPLWKRGIKGDF